MCKLFENSVFNRLFTSTFSVILATTPCWLWSARIHNAIATAMSICVAFGNKVVDTRLPLPVGSGDKYDVCCAGRSMIEMLGVLAIIAVLTAGGLVGFNKAMSADHWNMALGQWDTLINVVLKYKSQLHINDGSPQDILSLLPIFEATGDLPDAMSVENCGTTKRNCYVVDAMGNKIRVYNHNTGYIGIGYLISQNNVEACRLFMTMAKTYHNIIDEAEFYTNDKIEAPAKRSIFFYGDRICYADNKPLCLKDLSVSQINEICNDNKVCKDRETCNFLMSWSD